MSGFLSKAFGRKKVVVEGNTNPVPDNGPIRNPSTDPSQLQQPPHPIYVNLKDKPKRVTTERKAYMNLVDDPKYVNLSETVSNPLDSKPDESDRRSMYENLREVLEPTRRSTQSDVIHPTYENLQERSTSGSSAKQHRSRAVYSTPTHSDEDDDPLTTRVHGTRVAYVAPAVVDPIGHVTGPPIRPYVSRKSKPTTASVAVANNADAENHYVNPVDALNLSQGVKVTSDDVDPDGPVYAMPLASDVEVDSTYVGETTSTTTRTATGTGSVTDVSEPQYSTPTDALTIAPSTIPNANASTTSVTNSSDPVYSEPTDAVDTTTTSPSPSHAVTGADVTVTMNQHGYAMFSDVGLANARATISKPPHLLIEPILPRPPGMPSGPPPVAKAHIRAERRVYHTIDTDDDDDDNDDDNSNTHPLVSNTKKSTHEQQQWAIVEMWLAIEEHISRADADRFLSQPMVTVGGFLIRRGSSNLVVSVNEASGVSHFRVDNQNQTGLFTLLDGYTVQPSFQSLRKLISHYLTTPTTTPTTTTPTPTSSSPPPPPLPPPSPTTTPPTPTTPTTTTPTTPTPTPSSSAPPIDVDDDVKEEIMLCWCLHPLERC